MDDYDDVEVVIEVRLVVHIPILENVESMIEQ